MNILIKREKLLILRVVANKIQILEVSDSSESEEVNDAIIDEGIEEIKTSDSDDEIPF